MRLLGNQLNVIHVEFYLQKFKVAKDRYFAQLGELIKKSELEPRVKVEKRGTGAVISIEEDRDHVHGSTQHEEDEGTPEDPFITHEREGFSGTLFVALFCRIM